MPPLIPEPLQSSVHCSHSCHTTVSRQQPARTAGVSSMQRAQAIGAQSHTDKEPTAPLCITTHAVHACMLTPQAPAATAHSKCATRSTKLVCISPTHHGRQNASQPFISMHMQWPINDLSSCGSQPRPPTATPMAYIRVQAACTCELNPAALAANTTSHPNAHRAPMLSMSPQ